MFTISISAPANERCDGTRKRFGVEVATNADDIESSETRTSYMFLYGALSVEVQLFLSNCCVKPIPEDRLACGSKSIKRTFLFL